MKPEHDFVQLTGSAHQAPRLRSIYIPRKRYGYGFERVKSWYEGVPGITKRERQS